MWGTKMRKTLLALALGLMCAAPSMAAKTKKIDFSWYMTLKQDKFKKDMKDPVFITFYANKAYVADAFGGKLFSFTISKGKPSPAFYAGGKLGFPIAMAKLSNRKLVVIDRKTNELLDIEVGKKDIKRVKLSFIAGEVRTWKGNLFVLNIQNGTIVKLDGDFKPVAAVKDGDYGFTDFKIKNGKIYALEPVSRKVLIFDASNLTKLSEVNLSGANMLLPVAIAVSDKGNIYVLDRDAGNVKVFNKSGQFIDTILHRGYRRGKLFYPADIDFDKEGKLWVVEEGNGRVEVFTRSEKTSKKK